METFLLCFASRAGDAWQNDKSLVSEIKFSSRTKSSPLMYWSTERDSDDFALCSSSTETVS